jgi:putative oxidoreductase
MAACAESIGAGLLVIGLFFRPAALVLGFAMLVAALNHLNLPPDSPAAGWSGAKNALVFLSTCVAMALLGPGKYSLAPRWKKG